MGLTDVRDGTMFLPVLEQLLMETVLERAKPNGSWSQQYVRTGTERGSWYCAVFDAVASV